MSINDHITDYIDRYIRETRPSTSIMISGGWGTGKTYFVKNKVIPHLKDKYKNKRLVYITLNGISSISQLENRFRLAVSRLSKKNKSSEYVDGIDEIIEGFEKLKNYYEILKLISDALKNGALGDAVFFIDDIERSNLSIEEVLGFVSDLVEHRGSKCIIISNEDIIQYKNDNYSKIREKTISRVLYYSPDAEGYMGNLFEDDVSNEITKSADRNTVRDVLDGIAYIRAANVRTIKSTILIINEVYNIISKNLPQNNEVRKKVISELVYDIYHVENHFCLGNDRAKTEAKRGYSVYDYSVKEGDDPKEQEESFYFENHKESFDFIQDIVNEGKYNKDEIIKTVESYIEKVSFSGELSPVEKLKNFYYMEETEVIKQYNLMLDHLSKNKVPLESYSVVLWHWNNLNKIGFENCVIKNKEDIIEMMKKNISASEFYNFMFSNIAFYQNDNKLKDESDKILKEFANISLEANKERLFLKLNYALESDEWASKMSEVVNGKLEIIRSVKSFLSKLDKEKLLARIKTSSNKELFEFSKVLNLVYSNKTLFESDRETTNKLIDLLDAISVSNTIDRHTLNTIIAGLKLYLKNSFESSVI